MLKMERRFFKGAQVRASKGDKPQISGYASVFGEEYVLYDDGGYRIVETIQEGAFARVLKEKQDVRCLFNHEPDNVLGRTTNQTLRMSQDDKGLEFENDLDLRTTVGQNVQAFIDRGDVTGCSFAFTVSKQSWSEEKADGKTISTRVIEEFEQLFDVGPVTYPAYEATSVASRDWLNSAPAEVRGALRDATSKDTEGMDPISRSLVRICEKHGIKMSDELLKDLRASVGTSENTCGCACAECQTGDCENCSDAECDDAGCQHGQQGDADEDENDRAAALEEVDMRLRLAGLKATA